MIKINDYIQSILNPVVNQIVLIDLTGSLLLIFHTCPVYQTSFVLFQIIGETALMLAAKTGHLEVYRLIHDFECEKDTTSVCYLLSDHIYQNQNKIMLFIRQL